MLAIGLMSGTSLDGIDAALIDTDGEARVRPVAFRYEAWSGPARAQLAEATELALTFERPRASPALVAAGELVDRMHILAVRKLLAQANVTANEIDVIGYHGQTVAHRPDRGWTWQIGNGQAIADALGIRVVGDFRSNDVAQGGQGAPLLPVYHRALLAGVARPVAVLNLGGVGNLTWIGAGDELVAFDTGPANGLVDDWVAAHSGARYDAGGTLAATGRVDDAVLAAMLDHPWFDMPPPKSLDRRDFTMQAAAGLSPADGAATLTAFTAASIAEGLRWLPQPPLRLIVAGGGRHNPVMMAMIASRTGCPTEPIDTLALDGDAIEAQGFAYMAVRSVGNLPISFPGTTGCAKPATGGTTFLPR